jgi:glutamine amidotransferase
MIGIIDYGIGNLRSVSNMLRKARVTAEIVQTAQSILAADRLILPGVGHFDHGMRTLRASGLEDAIRHSARELRKPVLGICLGAQIIGKGSEEGDAPGLGLIDMECRRFPPTSGYRVPHMGWNEIRLEKPCPLFREAESDSRYYFVHSYYMTCADPADVAGTTEYGLRYASVVQRANIFGTQFHPEKSLRHGLAVLRAFGTYDPAEAPS